MGAKGVVATMAVLVGMVRFSVSPSTYVNRVLKATIQVSVFSLVVMVTSSRPTNKGASLTIRVAVCKAALRKFVYRGNVILRVMPMFACLLPT